MCELHDKSSVAGMTLPDFFVRPVLWDWQVNRNDFFEEKPIEEMIDPAMLKKVSVAVRKAIKAIEAMKRNSELMRALQIIRQGNGDKSTLEILCKEFDALEEELFAS